MAIYPRITLLLYGNDLWDLGLLGPLALVVGGSQYSSGRPEGMLHVFSLLLVKPEVPSLAPGSDLITSGTLGAVFWFWGKSLWAKP